MLPGFKGAMTMKKLLTRSAGPAIVAALAIGSIPLAAQQPAPAPAPAPAPTTAPSTAPSPVPQLQLPVRPVPPTSASVAPPATPSPDGAPPTNVFENRPVVQSVPVEPVDTPTETEAPVSETEAGSATSRSESRAAPAPAARPDPAMAAPLPIEAADGSEASPSPNNPIPVVPVQRSGDPVPVASASGGSQDRATDTAVWLGLLASGLGVIGLGLIAALALRRRNLRNVPFDVVERPLVSPVQPTQPVKPSMPSGIVTTGVLAKSQSRDAVRSAPLLPVTAIGSPTAAAPAPEDARPETVRWPERPFAASPAPQHAAPVGSQPATSLPRELPPTVQEREALLDRLVAAPPDRANPFRSRKARRKRARLIMQSIGRRFANGKLRLDLSQYGSVWPELAGRQSAAA
jgi:hypothetical protein